MENKSNLISNKIITLINKAVLDRGTTPPYEKLKPIHEEIIQELVFTAFKEGYKDCLKDVREGIIE